MEVLRPQTTQEAVEVVGVQSHCDRCLQSSKEGKVLWSYWWAARSIPEDPMVLTKSSCDDRVHRFLEEEDKMKRKRRVLDTYCYYLLPLQYRRGHHKMICLTMVVVARNGCHFDVVHHSMGPSGHALGHPAWQVS